MLEGNKLLIVWKNWFLVYGRAYLKISFLLSFLNLVNESDLQGIKTYARKDGSDYILNGSKMFITNGWIADLCVVVAVTNREAKSPAHGISLFLVDADTPGFKKSWLMKKIGQKATVSYCVSKYSLVHYFHCLIQLFCNNSRTRRPYFSKTSVYRLVLCWAKRIKASTI